MKVLLVKPPLPTRAIGAAHASLCEPLELEVLAGNLRDHDVTVLDMRVDARPFDNVLQEEQPDLVGVTASTLEVSTARAVLRRVKEVFPAVTTVVGGPHATARPDDFAGSFINAVVIGEGVRALRELVEAREMGRPIEEVAGMVVQSRGVRIKTPKRPWAASLDEFPPPDRRVTSAYRKSYYHAWVRPAMLIQASQGAAAPGTVGAPSDVPRLVQQVERVAAEVAEQDEAIVFADDDALAEPQRIARLSALLAEAQVRRPTYLCARAATVAENPEVIEDLAGVGLVAVALALETRGLGPPPPVEQRAIEVLHRNGVAVAGELHVDPASEVDDIRRLGDCAARLGIEFPVFVSSTPFPGTPLFEERKADLGTPDWEIFDRIHCVLPTRLSLRTYYSELARLYDKAYGPVAVPRMMRNVPLRELPTMALQLHRFAGRVRKAYLDQESGLHHGDGG